MNEEQFTKVIAGIIKKKSKVLIIERQNNNGLNGMWELPCGVLVKGESDEQCLKRVLLEKLGIRANIGSYFYSSLFEHNDTIMEMSTYYVHSFSDHLNMYFPQEAHWIEIEALPFYDLPEAHKAAAEELLTHYRVSQKGYLHFLFEAFFCLRGFYGLCAFSLIINICKGKQQLLSQDTFTDIRVMLFLTAIVAVYQYNKKKKTKNTYFIKPGDDFF